MSKLNRETCTACRVGAPSVTASEIDELHPQVPDWIIVEGQVPKLQRAFGFKNFRLALSFTIRVGDLAESAGHHPSILTEWGKVTVTWWTHAIKGLHRNDFIMAAKTDAVFEESVSK